MLQKFDPVIRTPAYYRKRLSAIYLLAAFVFGFAGCVAFGLDHVTLPGRASAAEFSGKAAHAAGVFCFFVAAWWFYQCIEQYRVSLLVLLLPFMIAFAASAALLFVKYA